MARDRAHRRRPIDRSPQRAASAGISQLECCEGAHHRNRCAATPDAAARLEHSTALVRPCAGLLWCGMKRDRPWTLVLALALFAGLNIYLQQPFWRSAADYDPLSLPRALALFASAVAAAATPVWLAPDTLLRMGTWCAAAVDRHAPLSRLALIACAGILPACIAAAALDGFPNSGDEYAYVFQAQQFAHGHLWAAPPPLDYALVAYRTWIIGDKWVSQYPPGWPAVLAPALALRLPGWLVTAALGALSTAVLFAIGRRLGNPLSWVVFAAGAYVLSLFYLLNAASFYSHMMTALLIVLLCWLLASYQRQPRPLTLLVCGSLLGLIGITR